MLPPSDSEEESEEEGGVEQDQQPRVVLIQVCLPGGLSLGPVHFVM